MPRFYFDVRDGSHLTTDEDGLDFESLETAEYEAATAAAEIVRGRRPADGGHQVTIEVRDERRGRVMSVSVLLQIERVSGAG